MSCNTNLCNTCNKKVPASEDMDVLEKVLQNDSFPECFSTKGTNEELQQRHCWIKSLQDAAIEKKPPRRRFAEQLATPLYAIGKKLRDLKFEGTQSCATGGKKRMKFSKKSGRGKRSTKKMRTMSRRKRKTSNKYLLF